MKSYKPFAAGLLLAFTAVGSFAQSTSAPKLYGELGFASIGLKGSDGADVVKSDPGLLMGTIGYRLLPNLAIEGFAGFGIVKDDVTLNGVNTGLKAKADSAYGVFIKPSIRPTESLELFGRLGWAQSKLALSANGVSVSESDSDMAWGIGVNYHFSPTSYLQWGWTQFYDKDGLDARGWSVSYGRRF